MWPDKPLHIKLSKDKEYNIANAAVKTEDNIHYEWSNKNTSAYVSVLIKQNESEVWSDMLLVSD